MGSKKIAQLIILFFNVNLCLAQTVIPKGTFIQDETRVGEEVQFALSVRYDSDLNIILPDSLYKFSSFEYNSREYFKTRTDSTTSFDSVIYNLSTFEIDSIQTLRLPVFVVNEEDSTAYYTFTDSIRLVQVVSEIPEEPKALADTDLVKIKKQFNYPYLFIFLGVLFIIVLVVAIFFGKQLSKAWKVYMMKKAHKKFVARFFSLMRDVSGNNPVNTTEHVLAIWKQYMEKLEKMPISKLTTKEILVIHNNSLLKENLKMIDRSIYGGERGNDLFKSFDFLMKFSIEIYEEKVKEIKLS